MLSLIPVPSCIGTAVWLLEWLGSVNELGAGNGVVDCEAGSINIGGPTILVMEWV